MRRPLVLLTAVALALVLYRPGPAAVAEAASPDPAPARGDLGPVSDWLDDLIDVVEEAKEALEDAESSSSGDGGSGWVGTGSMIAYYLDRADLAVSRILDPIWYPSLNPAGAGEIDETIQPSTLAEYSAACTDLAAEAFIQAMHDPVLNAGSIGSNLKTIQHLLPGYRKAAGIATTMGTDAP